MNEKTKSAIHAIKENLCIFCNTPTNEDLRKWFGKGGAGGAGGGGWDRYSSTGKRLGKCGGGKEGDAYAACLSKSKAKKLGSDYLIVGRTILNSKNPLKTTKDLVSDSLV